MAGSPFDSTEKSAMAWARYRRLMRFMFGITVATVIIALSLIYREVEEVSPHLFIAAALGIGFSMLLMSALMGLVFMSNSSGHDESVDDLSSESSSDETDPSTKPQ